MPNPPIGPFVPTAVLIRFEDGSESFTVPPRATLSYISEQIHGLSRWHEGRAISIDLHFKASEADNKGSTRPYR